MKCKSTLILRCFKPCILHGYTIRRTTDIIIIRLNQKVIIVMRLDQSHHTISTENIKSEPKQNSEQIIMITKFKTILKQ